MIKLIKNFFKSKKKEVKHSAWQLDFTEIMREKKQGEKPCITVTTICGLVLNATLCVFDNREEWNHTGIINDEMSDYEAIGAYMAFFLFNGFEAEFSPKLTFNYLNRYCHEEIERNFIDYYIHIANYHNIEFSLKNLSEFDLFDAFMDIGGVASNAERLNLRVHHNPFKQPYHDIWINSFG